MGEAAGLRWDGIHLDPVGDGKLGYVHVGVGKSRNAKRNVSLTARVRECGHLARSSARKGPRGPEVARGLRDTFVKAHYADPAWGGWCGRFTIMRIAGHSSITISQRYVHPSPESVERAFARLEASNQAPLKKKGGA